MTTSSKAKNKLVSVDAINPPVALQAKTLAQAINNLNEFSTLVFEKSEAVFVAAASPSFYVNRPDNPMEKLMLKLLTSPGNDKIIFSGHMGCGKSTELNRFAAQPELHEKFFVIKYSISDILNIIDIDYIDFLLSFATYLYMKASDEGISFSSGVLQVLENWISYLKSNVEELKDESKASIPKKIYNFFNRISMILLRELALRDSVRDTIRRNINGLVSVINILVDSINSHLGERKLLIIIDDLEKILDITKAEALFINAGVYMTQPNCKIIYTVPIALHYSIQFKQLTGTFGKSYFMPNIKVWDQNDRGELEPSHYMREFITKRIDPACIHPQAIDLIIEYSAGVPRECVFILKDACINAMARKCDVIDVDVVNKVIAEMRNEFDRSLSKRHIDVLRNIEQNIPVEDDKTLMELFHSKVLLEYTNGERWIAINPLVKPILEKYKLT